MGLRERKLKREEEEIISKMEFKPPTIQEINAQLDRDIANLEAESAAKKQVVLMVCACVVGCFIIAMLADMDGTWAWIEKHTPERFGFAS